MKSRLFRNLTVTTTQRRQVFSVVVVWWLLPACTGAMAPRTSLVAFLTPPSITNKQTRTIPITANTFVSALGFAKTAAASPNSSSSATSKVRSPVKSDEFETWAQTVAGAYIHPAIAHALFPGGVRGLTWNPNQSSSDAAGSLPKEPVLRIPQTIVLSSTFDKNENWDVELACTLWEEMRQGSDSRVTGYCQWLRATNGDATTATMADCPPSTAPHALRRWTKAQKKLLASEPAGAELLELAQRQDTAWRNKYQQIVATEQNESMSWEQFEWAIEVVHSRAFQGINAGADSSLLSIAAPLLAAMAGFAYANMNPLSDTTPIVLGILAVLAVLPSSVLRPKSSAVLLPLIDSANHLERADSSILFDPLTKTFDLNIGPACLDTATTQLYISYGPKGDRELLLNYGFLPNADTMQDNLTDDEIRTRLAAAYLQHNR